MAGVSPRREIHVRVRERLPGQTWGDWHDRLGGGPRLLLFDNALEVVAPQGMVLVSRDIILPTPTSSMWRDNIGFGGLPLAKRDCVRIQGYGPHGYPVELAITPCGDITAMWKALALAGVGTPAEEPERMWAEKELWRWLIRRARRSNHGRRA